MSQTTTKVQCCNKPAKYGQRTRDGKTYHAYWCETCGKRAWGETEAKARAEFVKAASPGPGHGPDPNGTDTQLAIPTAPEQLPAYVAGHMRELLAGSAAYIDRPALKRMVNRNVKYVVQNKNPGIVKLWNDREGQESIIRALEDAFELGATLPAMGSIVPFGTTCEFIPAVEAYEFALTQGQTAPFQWINIEAIHENDIRKIERKNGHFECSIQPGSPRGEVAQVAVYGYETRRGLVIGELYDASRLIEKAETHSPSYRTYRRNMRLFEQARTEGNVGTDSSGREYAEVATDPEDDPYFEQNKQRFEEAEKAGELNGSGKNQYAEVEIPKKGGGSFTKKIHRKDIEGATKRIYRDEMVNPYDGPDRPEMLRKAAGKSFLAKYVKVRNSVAAMDEMRSQPPESAEDAIDSALDAAFNQFDGGGGNSPSEDITNAEYTVADDPGTDTEPGAGNPVDGGEDTGQTPEPDPPNEDDPELF